MARLLSAAAVVVLVLAASWALWPGRSRIDTGGLPGTAAVDPPVPVFLVQGAGAAIRLKVSLTDLDAVVAAGGRALPLTITGRRLPLSGPGFLHQWPGIYATARFGGDTLVVAFDDAVSRYRLTLDAGLGPQVILTRPGTRAIRLEGLGPGQHSARLEKLSETSSAPGAVLGLFVPGAGDVLDAPAPLARQIEIIGDSDSVGFGVTSTTRDCSAEQIFLATDAGQTFGPTVARHFGAEYQLIARSGIGLVRNYDGANPAVTMRQRYPRVLPDAEAAYDRAAWAPQVIVIALGSNDFATALQAGERWPDEGALGAAFVAAMVAFLQDLRGENPDALLLLVTFPEYGDAYLDAQHESLAQMLAAGDQSVGLIEVPEMQKTACLWHPSVDDHRMIAEGIITTIEARSDVWAR